MAEVKLFEDREKVIELRKKIKELQEEEKKALAELREKCPHRVVLETPYEKTTFGGNLPRRICVYCSLEEEVWNPKKLSNKTLTAVNREEFYKFRELPELTFATIPLILIGENKNEKK